MTINERKIFLVAYCWYQTYFKTNAEITIENVQRQSDISLSINEIEELTKEIKWEAALMILIL